MKKPQQLPPRLPKTMKFDDGRPVVIGMRMKHANEDFILLGFDEMSDFVYLARMVKQRKYSVPQIKQLKSNDVAMHWE